MTAIATEALKSAGFINPTGRAIAAVTSITEATAAKFGTSPEAAAHAAAHAWASAVGLSTPATASSTSTSAPASSATTEEAIAREVLASLGIK
jgi:hypothetical protein